MRENELRGKLLAFLDHVYPDPVEEMGIIGALFEYHKYDDIKRALGYLADKGLVERDERPHPYREDKKVVLYRITAAGIDLKQGVTSDPGVTPVEW